MRHARHPAKDRTNKVGASLDCRHLSLNVDVEVTPKGLLAIGGLVSGILLSVVPIVWVSTRKLPPRTNPR